MAIRVLIVDDSGFFRRRLTEILSSDPQIEVIDTAVDGKDAIQKAKICRPDVITMDIEMPVMNGIDATREIMKYHAVPIIMFSSLTYDGAQATFEALEAGATDFLPKRFDDISNDKAEARNILCSRIKAMGAQARYASTPAISTPSRVVRKPPLATPSASNQSARKIAAPVHSLLNRKRESQTQHIEKNAPIISAQKAKPFKPSDYDVVAIGTSTGGPVALQVVLSQLPANFPLPLLLVQHMPAAFTQAFAERLNQQCKIQVREAKNGDELAPGLALLAPGGMQMKLEKRNGRMLVSITEETNPLQNYKPCVDVTFDTVVKTVIHRALGIILTGMGADGSISCKVMHDRGATIWAQDKASSVIYGMPAAVASFAEQILPMEMIGKKLANNC